MAEDADPGHGPQDQHSAERQDGDADALRHHRVPAGEQAHRRRHQAERLGLGLAQEGRIRQPPLGGRVGQGVQGPLDHHPQLQQEEQGGQLPEDLGVGPPAPDEALAAGEHGPAHEEPEGAHDEGGAEVVAGEEHPERQGSGHTVSLGSEKA